MGGNMKLHTNAFQQSQSIPQKYTCDGADVSPELTWEGAPANTKSFALICDDPDAPSGTFTHWVLYGLPSSSGKLPEGMPKTHQVDSPKSIQGMNGFGKTGYGGPCPPRGNAHRYYFKLYALDQELQLPSKAEKQDLEQAMKGHILDQAELMGTYQRK
jgi:Raf kinase inhibitor-like YbhB/YbcL family protein